MSSSSSSPDASSNATQQSTATAAAVAARPQDRRRRQQGLFFGGVMFVVFSTLITRRSLARRYKAIANASTMTPTINSNITTTPLQRGLPSSAQGSGYAAAAQAGPSKTTISQQLSQQQTQQQLQSQQPQLQSQSVQQQQQTPSTTATPAMADPGLEASGSIMAVEALTLATLNIFSWAVMATGGLLWYFDIGNMDDLRRRVRGGIGLEYVGKTDQEVEEEMEEWLATVLARKEDKQAKATAAQRQLQQD